jgi:hypothetical protein
MTLLQPGYPKQAPDDPAQPPSRLRQLANLLRATATTAVVVGTVPRGLLVSLLLGSEVAGVC